MYQNPLQEGVCSDKLEQSACEIINLFMCSLGAEAKKMP